MTETDHFGGRYEVNEPNQPIYAEIRTEIESATRERRVIDHRTARLIAEQLQTPDGPLARLAASGEVLTDQDGENDTQPSLSAELLSLLSVVPQGQERWLAALADYHLNREFDTGPIRGWEQLTRGPEHESTEAPKIFVISLDDAQAGIHHGAWIEADLEPEDLMGAIQSMLDRAATPEAVAWEIFDYSGFGGVNVFELIDDGDPDATLELVSRLAQGVAEHGEPFAAYIEVAGKDPETCLRFEERYLGRWASMADYAKHFADDLAWYEHLHLLPGWMRDYVTLDYGKLAAELRFHVTAAEGRGGGVHLFALE